MASVTLSSADLPVTGIAKQLSIKLVRIGKAKALSATVAGGKAIAADGADGVPSLLLRIGEEMRIALLALGQIVIAILAQHPIVNDIAIRLLERDRLAAEVAGHVLVKAGGTEPHAARVVGMGEDDLAAILALVKTLVASAADGMPLGRLHRLDLVDRTAKLADGMTRLALGAKDRERVFVEEIDLAAATVAFVKRIVAALAKDRSVRAIDLVGEQHLAASLARRGIDATGGAKNAPPLGCRDHTLTAGAADRQTRIAALAKDAILGGTCRRRQSQATAARANEMPAQAVARSALSRHGARARHRHALGGLKKAHGRRTRLGGLFRSELDFRNALCLGTRRQVAAFKASWIGTKPAAQTELAKLAIHGGTPFGWYQRIGFASLAARAARARSPSIR